MTYQFDYTYGTNSWHLAHTPDTLIGYTEPSYDLPGEIPEGDWSAYAEMFGVSDGGAIGLQVLLADGRVLAVLGAWDLGPFDPVPGGEHLYVRQHPGTIYLRIDYHSDTKTLVLRSAITPGVWQDLARYEDVTPLDTGLLLQYTDASIMVDGYLAGVSLVGTTEDMDGHTDLQINPVGASLFTLTEPAVSIDLEPNVYCLIGAPFGDYEFDIGKSARWLEYFSDDLFVLDINTGDPRYWIVNWTLTLPNAEHAVTSTNYFNKPAEFRQEQWTRANQQYNPHDEDWVLWVDGSEGLSFDNTSLPDDFDFLQFMSFIYREIARAETASEDVVTLPFFVFLRSDEVQNVTYDHRSNADDGSTPSVLQAMSVPYYLPYQGLTRLMKASVLRDPDFDWTSLDQPSTPSTGAKAQIVSYAYAHWQYFDIPPGQTEVPSLDENNDLGWQMRKKISKVRSVSGLPTTAWDPDDQPDGVPGPWGVYTVAVTNPDFVPISDTPFTEPDAAALGVKTPLYDCVIRLNMRDGVWYEGDVSGNTPMSWNPDTQQWQTQYNPDRWPDKGVGAGTNPDYVQAPTPVP